MGGGGEGTHMIHILEAWDIHAIHEIHEQRKEILTTPTGYPLLVVPVLVLLYIVLASLHMAVPLEDPLTVMLNSHLMTRHQTQSHRYLCPTQSMLWLYD